METESAFKCGRREECLGGAHTTGFCIHTVCVCIYERDIVRNMYLYILYEEVFFLN